MRALLTGDKERPAAPGNNRGGIQGHRSMPIAAHPVNRRRGLKPALLAMLLLCVGPLLSQWLVPAQPAWLAELSCSEHPASRSAGAGDSHGHDPLWAKCGYCTLLFSSPALTSPAPLLLGPAPYATSFILVGGAQHAPASPIFPGSRSRAPPLLS